jgi:hypothetical protein
VRQKEILEKNTEQSDPIRKGETRERDCGSKKRKVT